MSRVIRKQTEKQPADARWPLITAILVWCGLVVVSGIYITLPMGSALAAAFQAEESGVAWASSAFSFAYALGFLIFGPLSDRFGRRSVMFRGLLALGVVTPLAGLAADLPSLIAFRCLQGLVSATFAPSVMTYIVEMFPAQRRLTSMALVTTGFLVSAVAGQLFSGAVSERLGWEYVFHIHGVLAFTCAALLGARVPKDEALRKDAGLLSLYRQLPGLLLSKRLLPCYVISLTMLLSLVAMYAVFEIHLTREPFGLTSQGLMQVRIAGLAGLALSPFAGRLAAKFGLLRVLQGGFALAALGLGVAGLVSSLPALVLMSIVYLAGISLAIPTMISLVGALAGDRRGPAVTLYSLALFIGASVGPLAAVHLTRAASGFAALETLAALMLAAFGLSLLLKAPGPAPDPSRSSRVAAPE